MPSRTSRNKANHWRGIANPAPALQLLRKKPRSRQIALRVRHRRRHTGRRVCGRAWRSPSAAPSCSLARAVARSWSIDCARAGSCSSASASTAAASWAWRRRKQRTRSRVWARMTSRGCPRWRRRRSRQISSRRNRPISLSLLPGLRRCARSRHSRSWSSRIGNHSRCTSSIACSAAWYSIASMPPAAISLPSGVLRARAWRAMENEHKMPHECARCAAPPTYPVRPLIRFRLRVKMPSGFCCCSARATSIHSRAIFNNGSRIAGSSVMPASLMSVIKVFETASSAN